MMDRLKELEHEGYQFEGAESSFEMIGPQGDWDDTGPSLKSRDFKVIGEAGNSGTAQFSAYALVKSQMWTVQVKTTAAEGDGPVNALDKALRQSLEGFFPAHRTVSTLTDYKVRDAGHPGRPRPPSVRVLIETTDGREKWSTDRRLDRTSFRPV